MNNQIWHKGIIEKIDGMNISVCITQMSACAGCKASQHCNAVDARRRIIQIESDPDGLHEGMAVMISMQKSAANTAVVFGFTVPLILIVAVLTLTKLCGGSDIEAAYAALGILVPYYLTLMGANKLIKKNITFQIVPFQQNESV